MDLYAVAFWLFFAGIGWLVGGVHGAVVGAVIAFGIHLVSGARSSRR